MLQEVEDRGGRRVCSSQRECSECSKTKNDNETVYSAKGLRVSNDVGSANGSEQWPSMGPRVD